MSTFTAETVGSLAGPPWLADRRLAALERFGAASLPTTSEEIWRYSRIGELDLDRYRPVTAPAADDGPPAGLADRLDQIGARAALVVVRDGHVGGVEVDPGVAAKGVVVGRLSEAPEVGAGVGLGGVLRESPDPFVDLHDALLADPVVVRIPAGVVVEEPIVVIQWLDTADGAVAPRLVIDAGTDSEATVVVLQGSADVAGLALPITEVAAGDAARVRLLGLQEWGHQVWQLGHQVVRMGRDSTVVVSSVALGGDYARLRSDVKLEGIGATCELIAVYFGEERQMHDFRTLQDHAAPKTGSELLFKGAVEGEARSVYSGLIKIRPDAAGSSAFQTNRNIKLSPNAWAESVPNLEIENNDVRCSHASAVGPVDEDHRYYLESRGVPPDIAERLIVLGFFNEVIDRLPVGGLRPALRRAVADKFERREQPA